PARAALRAGVRRPRRGVLLRARAGDRAAVVAGAAAGAGVPSNGELPPLSGGRGDLALAQDAAHGAISRVMGRDSPGGTCEARRMRALVCTSSVLAAQAAGIHMLKDDFPAPVDGQAYFLDFP